MTNPQYPFQGSASTDPSGVWASKRIFPWQRYLDSFFCTSCPVGVPLFLAFWVSFIWYSDCYNKAPHLLSGIPYGLTNGMQFTYRLLTEITLYFFTILLTEISFTPVAPRMGSDLKPSRLCGSWGNFNPRSPYGERRITLKGSIRRW